MGRRESMAAQMGSAPSNHTPQTPAEKAAFAAEIDAEVVEMQQPFKSKFGPSDMRQLALVAHNHMKPAMKQFITTYSEVLKKFRITGTNTTMKMCKSIWGEDNPEIEYGLACTSGPLGGDAQVAALMCMEDLGGLIFFIDPLSAHPHQADIDSLVRLANCGNVIKCLNPASAMSIMHVFKYALESGSRGMIPSFFHTLESPAVPEYKFQQTLALKSAVASGGPKSAVASGGPAPAAQAQDPRAAKIDVKASKLAAQQRANVSDDDSSDSDDDDGDEDVVEEGEPVGKAPAGAPAAGKVQRRGSALAGVALPGDKRRESVMRYEAFLNFLDE